MINETLQWSFIAIALLLLLGVLRQVSLVLPPRPGTEIGGPPVGKRLPELLTKQLERIQAPGDASGKVLAFVTEGCYGCRKLLSSLDSSRADDLVLVARSPSAGFRSALMELRMPLVLDTHEEIWRSCEVTATPLVLRVGSDGRVISKEVTHDLSRLAD